MSSAALPHIVLLGVMFGTTLVVSRYSVGVFAPSTYVWLRLAISSLAFVVIYVLSRRRRWPTDRTLWRHGIILGVFGTAVPMTAFVVALQYQSAGVTALLITIGPAITALLAHFLLDDERLDRRKVLGIGLALGGAALLAASGESGLPDVSRASPIGYGLVIGALLVDSLTLIYTRKHLHAANTFDTTNIRMLTAAVVVAVPSLLLVGLDLSAATPLAYGALLYASLVATFGGFLLALWITQRYGPTAVSLTGYIIPVVAAVGGVLLLGETITPIMMTGMAIIAAGLVILNRRAAPVVELT